MKMTRKGDQWDNGMMESFFGSLKTKWITGPQERSEALPVLV